MTDRDFLQEVAARHQEIVDLRRFFHRHPETAREEFGTAKRIEEELDKAGIPHRRSWMPTSISLTR